MKFRLLYLLLLTSYIGNSQIISQAFPIYTPIQLQEDFNILRGALEDIHPGLYWYTSKKEMDSIFTTVHSTLDTAMDGLSYFRKLAPVISKIRCGHTGILPSEASRQVIRQGNFLPLEIKLIGGRAYCFHNLSGDTLNLKRGHQILKINGISIDSLIEFSNTMHPGDGFINTGKVRLLERHFLDAFAFNIGQPHVFNIEYIDQHKNLSKTTLQALPYKTIKEKKLQHKPIKKMGNLNLQFLNQSTAVLEVREFYNWKVDRSKVKFEDELKNIFHRVDSSGIRNLIIDLRDNDGGNGDLGLNLFSYFSDKPVIEFRRLEFRMKKSKYFRYSNRSGFIFWLQATVLNRTKKVNDSTYIVKNFKSAKPYNPSLPKFEGSVYILINGRSFSTTADFAALMKSYDKAIFIGEETGGGYYGNTSNIDIRVTLPNTKVQVWIPVIRYTTNVKPLAEFGRGIIPDYQIAPSIQDEIDEVDTEMNFALEIINKKTE